MNPIQNRKRTPDMTREDTIRLLKGHFGAYHPVDAKCYAANPGKKEFLDGLNKRLTLDPVKVAEAFGLDWKGLGENRHFFKFRGNRITKQQGEIYLSDCQICFDTTDGEYKRVSVWTAEHRIPFIVEAVRNALYRAYMSERAKGAEERAERVKKECLARQAELKRIAGLHPYNVREKIIIYKPNERKRPKFGQTLTRARKIELLKKRFGGHFKKYDGRKYKGREEKLRKLRGMLHLDTDKVAAAIRLTWRREPWGPDDFEIRGDTLDRCDGVELIGMIQSIRFNALTGAFEPYAKYRDPARWGRTFGAYTTAGIIRKIKDEIEDC